MAVFRPQRNILAVPTIFEMPGKIFIEGQAHDATTLAPLFNQSLPLFYGQQQPTTNTNGLFSLSNRFWLSISGIASNQKSSGAPDFSLLDGGQGKLSFAYQLANVPNTLAIGPDSYGNVQTKFFNTAPLTTGMIGTGSPVNPNYDSAMAFAFYENATTVFHLSHPQVGVTYSAGAYCARIISTNTSTGVSASIFNVGSVLTLLPTVGDSASTVYFCGIQAVSIGTATTHTLYTFDKGTGTVTSRGSSPRPTTAGGPSYFPSYSISTGTNTRTLFNAEIISTTGSQLNFVVCTYDITTPATAPVWTTVVPTGATGMLGTLTQSVNLTMRTWTFNVGSNTYICVGSIDQSTNNSSGLAATAYVLHVYKCATATPTVISYVSSILLNQTSHPQAIIPTDSTFANLVMPTGNSLDFYSWNQVTEAYVKSSSVSMAPMAVSIDQTGRIWANENNTNRNANLNVFSPTISSTVTVTFDTPVLSYAGVVLNANLIVNAYSFAGARIVNNVTIILDSNNCTFADGSTTKTVSTLSTGDLLVPIKVTGAGYVRVLANLSI